MKNSKFCLIGQYFPKLYIDSKAKIQIKYIIKLKTDIKYLKQLEKKLKYTTSLDI